MNRFFVFVRKEFYHILRDRRTLLILFGIPLAQVLLFGFALTNEIKDARIAILDQDKSVYSKEIGNRLLSSGYFKLAGYLQSPKQLEAIFRKGQIKLALVFPPGFSDDWQHGKKTQIQILADASEQNTAIALNGYASAIIQDFAANATGGSRPMSIEIASRMVFNPNLKGAFVFVPGVMAMVLLLVSAMMTSITLAREKETGTMEVLFVSPLNQIQIILGKVIPYLVLSFINGCVILLLGVFVLGMPMAGNLILLLAETLLFIFLSLSIGIFISSITNSQVVAMFMSLMILLMPTIFLSGFIFPIESMPVFLQYFSNIIPAKYFINIVKGIMIKGIGLSYLIRETLILLGMAALFILLSLRNLKTRVS
jgi:ABC-2 type transport system permease protein